MTFQNCSDTINLRTCQKSYQNSVTLRVERKGGKFVSVTTHNDANFPKYIILFWTNPLNILRGHTKQEDGVVSSLWLLPLGLPLVHA